MDVKVIAAHIYIYINSKLGYTINNSLLNIPKAEHISNYNGDKLFPYVFIADDALSLERYMDDQ